jgi:hypothetical protein
LRRKRAKSDLENYFYMNVFIAIIDSSFDHRLRNYFVSSLAVMIRRKL